MKEVNGTKLFSVEELSSMMDCNRRTIYQAAKSGKLRVVRIGRLLYASEESLKDFLNGRK